MTALPPALSHSERVRSAWQARLEALALTAREEVALEAQAAWHIAHPGPHRLTRAQLRNCWALYPAEADAFEAKLAAAGLALHMEV